MFFQLLNRQILKAMLQNLVENFPERVVVIITAKEGQHFELNIQKAHMDTIVMCPQNLSYIVTISQPH